MDDQGINKYLEDTYGTTVDGKQLFRLTWTTGITERRFSEFHDFYGEILIRVVREVREVLKYPFAQNRWALERVYPITDIAREMGLASGHQFSYEEFYIFQDKNGNALPISLHKVEEAMFLFFKYMSLNKNERYDIRKQALAHKEMEKKKKTREALGESRSPLFFTLE